MKTHVYRYLFVLFLFLTGAVYVARAQSVSDKEQINFRALLENLLNRDNLARYPNGMWTLHHASSYDRRSVAKDKKGWYANNDYNNYIRKEKNNGREEYVLMDAKGPGAIVRFWGGGHPNQKGHLRIYIDGRTKPLWEADHWGALIGQNQLVGTPLSERSVDQDRLPIRGSRPGHDLYAPIPFEHHIKITYDKKPGGVANGFWYNIDYRIYKPDAPVKSFSSAVLAKDKKILQRTNKTLKHFMGLSPLEASATGEKKTKNVSFNLAPQSSKEINLEGGASIKRLLLSLEADTMDKAMKNTVLQIAFDGKRTVDVPVGFFFGCGDQLAASKNWYSKVDTKGNMASYWVMPYQQKAVIRLINIGDQKVSGYLKVALGTWRWNDNSMYFHASFKRLDNFMTQARKGQDINHLNIEGESGVYVGDILQVSKRVGGWWGEGDEKIYVDNNSFPVDFGTGSEDYYGYAWGHPETFNHVFFSQPIGNANYKKKGGTTVDSRVRGLDGIPFRHSFRFDMESWNWFGGPVDFAWACFYYVKR